MGHTEGTKVKRGTTRPAKRLRTTGANRLTELVALAYDDPRSWEYARLAAWLLPDDGQRFRSEWGSVFAMPIPAEVGDGDRREIQLRARSLVEWTLAHHERGGPAMGEEADREFIEAVPIRKVNVRLHCFRGGHMGTVVVGRVIDCFALVAVELLGRAPVGSLQRCAECDQVFARVGRMVYCGRRCANRVNQRLWRKGQKGRAANRRSVKKVKTRARYGVRVTDATVAESTAPWGMGRSQPKRG